MDIRLIQIPYDSGRRGERMGRGPLHFIDHKADETLRVQGWNVTVETVESQRPFQAEISTAFELAQGIAKQVRMARQAGAFPIVLAGNCISCLGTITGSDPGQLGMIWFDAHGDLNTPDTTQSGFLDGMGLSAALGRCWQTMTDKIDGFIPIAENKVLMVGIRSLDPAEESFLSQSPIQAVRGETIREHGLEASLSSPLHQLNSLVKRVYIHIDLDVFDTQEGHANSYAEPNGLRLPEMLDALSMINQHFEIAALSFTSYDPEADTDQRIFQAALQVMSHTVQLVEAALP